MRCTPSAGFYERFLSSGLPRLGQVEARLYAADIIDPGGWPPEASAILDALDALEVEDEILSDLRRVVERHYLWRKPTFANFRPAGVAIPLDVEWQDGALVAWFDPVWTANDLIEHPTHLQLWDDNTPITELGHIEVSSWPLGEGDTLTVHFHRGRIIEVTRE
jgi:hypothetical protein